jgi:hypothetical protein
MLTGLIGRPDRLIYLSSGLHHAGATSLRDIDWTSRSWNAAQADSESKLPRNRARAHRRARLARRTQQRRRSGLGPDQDGRPRDNRRSADGLSHADMTRRQQRRRRGRERRLLVPPATTGARTTSPRPGFPGPADGPAGRAHRRHAEAQVPPRDRLSCQPPSSASWVCDCRLTTRAWPSLALGLRCSTLSAADENVRILRGTRRRVVTQSDPLPIDNA